MDYAVQIHADPTELAFTKDDAWHTVDIASGLEHPDDCVGVMLRAQNTHADTSKQFGVCGGCPAASGHYLHIDSASGIITTATRVVVSGDERNVNLRATDSAVDVYIAAEFYSPGAYFLDAPSDISPTVSGDVQKWLVRTVDLDGEAAYDEVEAVILNVHHHTAFNGEWGARDFGASTNYRWESFQDNMGHSQLCKATAFVGYAIFNIWCDGKTAPVYTNFQEFLELGFIKKGYGFQAVQDIAPESSATTSGWETRTAGAVPEHASGMFGQIGDETGTGTIFGARSIGATPAHAPWRIASDLQDTCFAVELNSGQQFELFAESGFTRDIYVHGYTYPPNQELDLGEAVAVAATSGELLGVGSLDLSSGVVAAVTSGELGRALGFGGDSAVAALTTSGELGGYGSLGFSPAVAALTTSGELGGYGSLGLSTAVATLTTSGELGGYGSLGLSAGVLAAVASGEVTTALLVSLGLSPAVAELFASGTISEATGCEWFDTAEEAWRVADGALGFTSPTSGGWFIAEGAQAFTSPADGGWHTRKPCG